VKDVVVFDSEVVPSHYLFAAKRLSDGKVVALWGDNPEDMERLGALLRNPNLTWVGFNSASFDIPIALAAASGASVSDLKRMANDLIENKKPQWMAMRDYALEAPDYLDHIDLIEVAPGVMVSLKLYGGRMASPHIIDMPFHHDEWLDDEQAKLLLDYCVNDLDETARLFNQVKGQLELREQMSEKYGINLMSKSDGQMAETIIAKELGLLRAGKVPVPRSVRYKAPAFIQPEGKHLKYMLQAAEAHVFSIHQGNGSVELPTFLEEPVLIGDGIYQMGVGGLHSKHDRSVSYVASDDFIIRDADVAGFYPALILAAGYVPRGLGMPFLNIFRGFVNDRLVAKRTVKALSKLPARTPEQEKELAEAKVKDAGGKLATNSTFGKLGSMFSKIYSPDLMLAVTLTGQFYLLTLIEHLTGIGLKVISANTDGVTFAGTPDKVEEATKFIEVYGWSSNFEFEFVDYRSISLKDVNNYVAVKPDGSTKAKGIYADSGLQKNPTNEICSLAAREYLAKGTPVRETILRSFTIENFPDFLQVRTVKGGAVQYAEYKEVDHWVEVRPGEWNMPGRKAVNIKRKSRPAPVEVGYHPTLLGRVARWYYSTDPAYHGGIRYQSNGNLVPKSTGGRACMKLPDTLPVDVDVQRYIDEAIGHLHDMGVRVTA
jgi:hypothetical protein